MKRVSETFLILTRKIVGTGESVRVARVIPLHLVGGQIILPLQVQIFVGEQFHQGFRGNATLIILLQIVGKASKMINDRIKCIFSRLFFTICLFVLFSVFPLETDAKTDREVMGLVGSVHTVLEESNTGGKEGGTIFGNLYTYDKEGRQIEFQFGIHKVGGSINDDDRGHKTIRSYDSNTRKEKTTFFRSDGSIYGKSVTTYNASGDVKEHLNYIEDGSLFYRMVYIHDKQGRKVGEQYYQGTFFNESVIEHKIDKNGNRIEISTFSTNQPDKTKHVKSIITFNKQGNVLERVIYSANNSVESKSVYSYNEKGIETGSNSYNSDGSLSGKTTYVYEFDSVGNWIKKTFHNWESKGGKLEPKPPLFTKRTITYYESTKDEKK